MGKCREAGGAGLSQGTRGLPESRGDPVPCVEFGLDSRLCGLSYFLGKPHNFSTAKTYVNIGSNCFGDKENIKYFE